MEKLLKCPNCKRSSYVKNGHSGRGNNQNQKYKCKCCGKTFVEHNETLSRSEKRLLSMMLNLINYNADEKTTLKTISTACSKEIPKIGHLTLTVKKGHIDLNKLENVAMVVCQSGNDIQIIKTCPEEVIMTLSEWTNYYKKYMDEILNG